MTSLRKNGIRFGGCLEQNKKRNRWERPTISQTKIRDNRFGWIKPPGTLVKRDKIKEISKRKAYKLKDTLGLLPARKMWLIEMDPPWCVDHTLLNSKAIMKLLWVLETNPDTFLGLNEQGYVEFIKNYKMAWRRSCGSTMYDRMLPIEPMPDTWCEEGPAGRMRLKKALIRVLTKEGGVKRIQKLESEARPDAVGNVIKCGKPCMYKSFPCDGNTPIVQCGVCNMLNLYSHIDHGEELDAVQWRCACCYADLGFEFLHTIEAFEINKPFDKMLGIHGGSHLDELMLMNYGDVYDDLTEEAKSNFVKKDVALIRKYFNNAYQCVVEIGTNLTMAEKTGLQARFPRLFFVYCPRSSHGSKTTMYELSAMIADNRPRGRQNPLRVTGHIGDIYPRTVMEPTDLSNAEMLVASRYVSLSNVISEMKDSISVIIPVLDTEFTGVINYLVRDGKIMYQYGPTGTVGIMSKTLYETLVGQDMLVTNNCKILISMEQETTTWQLFKLTKMDKRSTTGEWRRIQRAKPTELEIPLPDFYGALSNPYVQTWKRMKFRFDLQLMNMLIIRNLTGSLGFYSLREFAVGYALRSYSAQGKVGKNLHILYEMVDAHTMIAMLVSKTMVAETNVNSVLHNMQDYPVLKSAGVELANELTRLVIESTKLAISELAGVSMARLTEQLKWGVSMIVPGWEQKDSSLNDLVNRPITELKSLRVKKITATTKKMLQCMHHLTSCDKCKTGQPYCVCCGWALQTIGNKCECCAAKTTIDMLDYTGYIKTTEDYGDSKQQKKTKKREKKTLSDSRRIQAKQQPIVAVANRATRMLRSEAIDVENNQYVTANNFSLSMVMNNPTEYFVKNVMESSSEYKSVIRYNVRTEVIGKRDWYEIESIHVNPDVENSNCAREAFMAATGIEMMPPDILELNADGMVMAHDILKLANKLNENIIICHSDGTLLTQNNSSNEFGTIIHGSLIKDVDDNHFMPGKIRQTNLIRNFPNRLWHAPPELIDEFIQNVDNSMDMDNVSHDVALQVDAMLNNELIDPSLNYQSLMPKIIQVEGESYFTNNREDGVHNLYAGSIHMKIRNELADAYRLISSEQYDSHRDIEVSSAFDRLHLDIDNLEYELNKELKAEVGNWLAIVNMFNDGGKINHHDVKGHHSIDIKMKHGVFYCELLPKSKLKTLDIVFIKMGPRIVKTLVIADRVHNRLVLRPSMVLNTGKTKMWQLKASFSSLIRKLCNAGRTELNFKTAKQLMSEMRLIAGDGGSGKTEELARDFKKGDIAVAMTTSPVETIKARLQKFGKGNLVKQVMTLERASTMQPKITGTIYADEAKQLSLMALLPIITVETKNIVLVGDTSQAGAVDNLNKIVGERYAFNLTEAVRKPRIKTLKGSKRIGYPLADQVAKLKPGFVGNKEKSTTFDIKHFKGLLQIVEQDILALIKTMQYDVLLAPQHDNVMFLKNLMGNKQICELSTTFGYQSKEANKVMLLLMPNQNGKWGISRDKWLLISALTRAKEHIDIVVVNSEANEVSVDELVEVMGAALYSRETFEAPLEVQQQMATEQCARWPGTSVLVEKIGDETVYSIMTPFGLADGKMTYNDGIIKVEGNERLKTKIIESVDTDNLQVSMGGVKIDSMNLDKLRALTWIIDKVISTENGLKFYNAMGYYRLSKSNSCPYNAGIKLYSKIPKLSETLVMQIESGGTLSYLGQRKLTVKQHDETVDGLLEWLEVVCAGQTFTGDPWLEGLIVPPDISKRMLWERLSRIPSCMLHAVTACNLQDNCAAVKVSSSETVNKIIEHSGIKMNKKIEHVVNHKMIVTTQWSWLMTKLNYGLYIDGEMVGYHRTSWSARGQMEMWNMMLEDTANLRPLKICGELEGLNMSLAKHKEHRTDAYRTYRNKMSAIKSYTIDSLNNTLWVSKGRLRDAKMLIQSMSMNIYVNEHNYKVDDMLAELFDGYLLLARGSISKGMVVTYAGLEPMLPSLYNMHYMKLWYSNNSNVRLGSTNRKLEMALDQIGSFLKAITEDTAADISAEIRSAVIKTADEVGSRIILGTALMYTTEDEIFDWLTVKDIEIYGYMPTIDIDERLATIIMQDGRHYLVSDFSGVQAPINESIMTMLLGASPLKKTPTGKFMHVEVMDTILGMALIKLTAKDYNQPWIYQLTPLSGGDNMQLELPWMNTNIKQIVRDKVLISKRRVSVKPHMFRSLCMRMLLDSNVQFKDVLAYARTLGSAYETSEINFRMKYSVKVDVLRDTAYAAWYYHKQMGKKFAVASKMWTNLTGGMNDLTLTNVMAIIKELMAVIVSVSDKFEVMAEQINEVLKPGAMRLGLPINWLAQCDDQIKLLFEADKSEIFDFADRTLYEEPDEEEHEIKPRGFGPTGDKDDENDKETVDVQKRSEEDRDENDEDNEAEENEPEQKDEKPQQTEMELSSAIKDWLDAIWYVSSQSKSTEEQYKSLEFNDRIELAEEMQRKWPDDQGKFGNFGIEARDFDMLETTNDKIIVLISELSLMVESKRNERSEEELEEDPYDVAIRLIEELAEQTTQDGAITVSEMEEVISYLENIFDMTKMPSKEVVEQAFNHAIKNKYKTEHEEQPGKYESRTLSLQPIGEVDEDDSMSSSDSHSEPSDDSDDDDEGDDDAVVIEKETTLKRDEASQVKVQEIMKEKEQKGITISNLVTWINDFRDKGATVELIGSMKRIVDTTIKTIPHVKSKIKELTSTKNEYIAPSGTATHVMIIAVGSTGEIVPMLKLGTMLLNSGLYSVTMVAQKDPGVMLPAGMGYSQIGIKVVPSQQLVIEMTKRIDINVSMTASVYINARIISAALRCKQPEIVIANVICSPATIIANNYGARLLITTPAIERVASDIGSYKNFKTGIIDMDERAVLKPILALGWFNVTGKILNEVPIDQLDFRQRKIAGLFPKEWLDLYGKELKYNIVPLVSMENIIKTTDQESLSVKYDIIVLSGSTFGDSWINIMNLMEKEMSEVSVLWGISILNINDTWEKLTGKKITEKPSKWTITKWIDYSKVKNCNVITHGGAGVMANITSANNKILVLPMLGDNFANADWASKLDNVITGDASKELDSKIIKELMELPLGKIEYDQMNDETKRDVVLNWIKQTSTNNVKCKCSRKHCLLHYVGTRGDYNSIVECAKTIIRGHHVIVVTHRDAINDMPSGWLRVELPTTTHDSAMAAAETMGEQNLNISGPLNHYRKMVSDSLEVISRIDIKIDLVVTSFFTPMATTLGVKYNCPTIHIDAIPNEPFYKDGKELITGLPFRVTQAGDVARHKLMETIDQQAINVDSSTTDITHVVTCHKNLYEGYLIKRGNQNLYNVFVNDKSTKKRTKPLSITYDKNNVLISFGSIPCEDRISKIIYDEEINKIYTVRYSGVGNHNKLMSNNNYIRELNYPTDLSAFHVIVHHGGVGTTWNCIKAGVVQIIWPIFGDQHIWSQYVMDKGVGYMVNNLEDLKTVMKTVMAMDAATMNEVRKKMNELTEPYDDDMRELMEMMNWEMSIKDSLRWPFRFPGIEVEPTLEVGEYKSSAVPVRTLFDPNTVIGCTRSCVEKVGELEADVQGMLNWSTPDYGELKRNLRAHRINYRLFLDGKFDMMEVNDTRRVVINLDVQNVGNNYHCKLVMVRSLGSETKIKRNTMHINDMINDRIMGEARNKSVAIESILKGEQEMLQIISDKLLTRSFKMDIRMTRQENPLTICNVLSVTGTDRMKVTIGTNKLKDDWLYMAAYDGCDDTSVWYVSKYSDRTILVNVQGNDKLTYKQPLIGVENARLKDASVPGPLLKTTDWVFINNACKKSNTISKRKHYPVLSMQTHYKLVVDETDNGKHDKYDVKQQILNAEKYVIPRGITREKFKEVFMSDRKIYLSGQLYEQLPNQPCNRAQLIAAVKKMASRVMLKKAGMWYALLDDKFKTESNLFGEPKTTMTWAELSESMQMDIKTEIESKFVIDKDTKFDYNKDEKVRYETILNAQVSGCILTENGSVLMPKPVGAYRQRLQGAGLLSKGYAWWSGNDKKTTTKDWWGLRAKTETVKLPIGSTVEAMHGHLQIPMNVESKPGNTGIASGYLTQKIGNELMTTQMPPISYHKELPDFDAMIFWSDNELIDWLAAYAPFESKMKSTEWPQRKLEVTKHTLTEFPKYSRPVQTKVSMEEQRSIAGRLFSIKKIRKDKPEVNMTMELIYKAYFHDKASEMVSKYKEEPLYYDSKESIRWMENHKSTDRVYEDLKKTLDAGLYTDKMSDIKIHIKLESLLKDVDKVIKRWEQQKARIIVWQRYAVAAIFSPIFTKAKKRLHQLYHNRVVYADGKTPEECSDFIRGTGSKTKLCMSTDLEQQDRQTDEPIIEVEFEVYKDLGVHEDVLSAWRMVHEDWRFKGTYTKGYRHSMRLTGQSTTSIGNAITTMQTHAKFVYENRDKITFVIILGDDNCIGLTEFVNTRQFMRYVADNFNMVAKTYIATYGEFCHFIVYERSDNHWEMGPDYVRLKNRYEVTNGVSEATEENLKLRTMSYAMTIGSTPEVNNLIEKDKMPIKPSMWYDRNSAMAAMQAKNQMGNMEILENYELLITMMTERKIHEKTLTIMSSRPRKS